NRAVRRRLPQPAWLGADARGKGHQVHLLAGLLSGGSDQTAVSLRLDRRRERDALRRRPDRRPSPSPAGLRRRLPPPERAEVQREDLLALSPSPRVALARG